MKTSLCWDAKLRHGRRPLPGWNERFAETFENSL